MKKTIIFLSVFLLNIGIIFPQIGNPYFTSKQLKEIEPMVKTFSFFPNYFKYYSAPENPTSKKLNLATSITMGGITSTLIENWGTGSWNNYKLTTYSFDLGNNKTGYVVQNWDNGNWINSLKLGIVLNEQTFPAIDSLQFWENNNWENKFRHYYKYNSNNDVTALLTQMWNDTTNVWENILNFMINYDNNFKIINTFTEIWSDTGWTPLFREYYYYNDADSCKGRLSQIWMIDEFIDNERITYKYNNKHLKTEELDESWVFSQSKWMKTLQFKYEYNTNNQVITKYDQRWDLNTGKSSYKKILMTYNNKLLIKELTQISKEDKWTNAELESYTYNNDKQITIILWQKWDSVNNKWYNFQRWTNRYGTLGGIKNEGRNITGFSLSQNYPNPFNPATIIEYSISANNFNTAQNVTLSVFNLLGKRVSTLVNQTQNPGQYKVTFNAENLPSGLYFYRLRVGKNILTKKCLLIK